MSKAELEKTPLEDWRTEYAQRLRDEIAADWCVKNVGDICSIRTGKLDVNQADEDGAYPFFTCAEKVYRINTPAFDAEAVLLAGNGDFNVKYYKGKFNPYQRTYVLSDLQVDGKYLYYYISYRLRDLTGDSRGSTIKYIRLGDVRDYPVPVAPLVQQKRIVAEIEKQFSRLDEAVANLKRIKANLKRYKAAVLKAAVEGRLVETEAERARREGRSYETGAQLLQRILETRRNQWQGKGKYKETAAPDTTALPKLPEGWVWASLGSLIVDGPQNGLYLPKSLYGSGHPILRIDDYQQDWMRPITELQRVRAKPEDVVTYSLRSGDIVINRVNSPSHLGKVAVWAIEAEMPLFESNMMRAALSSGVVPLYVATYLRSLHGRARLTKQAKWAVNQASINQQDVCGTQVPLPSLAEQNRIVAEVELRISVLRETEAQVDANFRRTDRLRQSILSHAFASQ
ncbi:MAG: restriction endonuclease subunit S [Thiobacillaceae bacterium]